MQNIMFGVEGSRCSVFHRLLIPQCYFDVDHVFTAVLCCASCSHRFSNIRIDRQVFCYGRMDFVVP